VGHWDDDNIVWRTSDDDNIVWGTKATTLSGNRDRRSTEKVEVTMDRVLSPHRLDLAVATMQTPEPETAPADWRVELPTLAGSRVVLRDLRLADAPLLFAAMSSEESTRFISPPPTSVEGFERFIAWSHRQRTAGQYISFAIVPRGSETTIGLIQLRSLEPDFGTAEWGFALAKEFWGAGMFTESARLVIDYAFDVVGARRLEARAALSNGRGNGALRKIGAVQEGVLRRSFLKHGEYLDQALWTILREDWLEAKSVWGLGIIH
jgi:ribosomal-protein-alanine N-acetyltransferase